MTRTWIFFFCASSEQPTGAGGAACNNDARQRREQQTGPRIVKTPMGKKSRIVGGAVGRRTILQLSPPGLRGGAAGERDEGGSGSDGIYLAQR